MDCHWRVGLPIVNATYLLVLAKLRRHASGPELTARGRMPIENELMDAFVEGAIRNPANPNHFMILKPVARRVRIFLDERLIADTTDAICLVEIGRKAYDPVLYVPPGALTVPLDKIDKTSHCPLKGDASYYALDGEEVGWAYHAPFDFAAELANLHAFWSSKVRIEQGG
jgi:uncharacterized protein (DUF427 family)